MIIKYDREKRVNAITYFLNKTSWYGKKKIYKLLFILDFEHYKETGRSVTGFNYYALQMGPVPLAMHEAIDTNDETFIEFFDIKSQRNKNGKTDFLIPKTEFNKVYFSKRELRLLEDISQRFDMSSGDDMVWYTHKEDDPWDKVWRQENNHFAIIPYNYALDDLSDEDKSVISQIAEERVNFLENYK